MHSRAAITAGVVSFLAMAFVISWVAQGPIETETAENQTIDADEVLYLGSEGVILQNQRNDCGLAALMMIFRHHGIDSSADEVERETGLTHRGASLLRLKEMATLFGLHASGWRVDFEDLAKLQLPAILFVDNRHFVVVDSVDNASRVFVRDPAVGRIRIPGKTLMSRWRGEVLVFTKDNLAGSYGE